MSGVLRFYDRTGRQLADAIEWGSLSAQDDYRILQYDALPNGRVVSTIWEGFDSVRVRGEGIVRKPLIFETVVFRAVGSSQRLFEEHTATEDEALAMHAATVLAWSDSP